MNRERQFVEGNTYSISRRLLMLDAHCISNLCLGNGRGENKLEEEQKTKNRFREVRLGCNRNGIRRRWPQDERDCAQKGDCNKKYIRWKQGSRDIYEAFEEARIGLITIYITSLHHLGFQTTYMDRQIHKPQVPRIRG